MSAIAELPEQETGTVLATVVDAAEYLNVGRSTIYGLMDVGKIAYVKIGRCRRIPWEELERVAREGTE